MKIYKLSWTRPASYTSTGISTGYATTYITGSTFTPYTEEEFFDTLRGAEKRKEQLTSAANLLKFKDFNAYITEVKVINL